MNASARFKQPSNPRTGWRWRLLALLFGVMPGLVLADGLNTSAEYIVGFVRYVHWATEDSVSAWQVCIIGTVPLEQDKPYASEIVRGKHFAVRRIGSADSIADCHVLDLTGANKSIATAVIARARHQPILSVGAGSSFCSDGGQMCLHLADQDQKFEINLSAVRESGLSMSARLITMGTGRTAARSDP